MLAGLYSSLKSAGCLIINTLSKLVAIAMSPTSLSVGCRKSSFRAASSVSVGNGKMYRLTYLKSALRASILIKSSK